MQHDPGRAAYEARFAHARPRDVEPWDSLTPEVKAIWAHVEAKSRGQVVARSEVREALTEAVRAGLSESSRWASAEPGQIADELIAGPLTNLVASAAEADRWGSEYADAMNARMEDAAYMETLRVAVLVLAECKIGSGLAAVRKWFADGSRGPIPWPDGTMFADWAAQHDIHDCNGAMGFRRGDRGRAA